MNPRRHTQEGGCPGSTPLLDNTTGCAILQSRRPTLWNLPRQFGKQDSRIRASRRIADEPKRIVAAGSFGAYSPWDVLASLGVSADESVVDSQPASQATPCRRTHVSSMGREDTTLILSLPRILV